MALTIMTLTIAAINAVKPDSKQFKLADEKGLYLLVHTFDEFFNVPRPIKNLIKPFKI